MARSSVRILAWLSILAAFFAGRAISAPEDYEGRRVAQILFEPPLQPLPDEELLDILPVKVGQELRLLDVRQAIVRLFATGRYRDISVDAVPAGEEVTLRFLTRSTWFVGQVSVEGVNPPPEPGQLLNATGLQLGREFSEDSAEEAAGNIQAILEANGLYEASVDRVLDYQPSFAQVNVVFLADPGPRAKFAPPEILGATGREAKRIVNSTNWERFWFLPGWKPVTERRVQRGLERIRKSYLDRDFLLAKVALESMDYDRETRRATPRIRVSQGPEVRVTTSGAKLSRGRLRRLVPVQQEQSVDRDLLVDGMRNITEYFQAKGYFDAAVDFQSEEASPDSRNIVYLIEPGERYKLVHLEISGNRYFGDETLRERMQITPATTIRYRHGRYSEAMLDGDVAALESLYRANGFRDVAISARTENSYRGEDRDVAVFLQVDEGPQWTVASLQIEGVDEEHQSAVQSRLASFPGQPFSEASLATDRDNILDYYYNGGYPDAGMDWAVEESAPDHTVDLRLTVREGQRRYVRASLIGGLDDTDPDLVYQRIELGPGDPLSQSRLVQSQRQLYDLGIFARVDQAVQNPEGQERRKYLLHQFEEARKYSVNFGIGAQIARIGGGVTDFENPAGATGFSPRVSFGITRSNMFGIGHTASLQGRVSETRQRGLLNYFAPQFKGREDVNLTITGLSDFSKDINTFESSRLEASAQFTQQISRADSFQYRATYRQVKTDNLRISPELIPIFAQTARVGLLSIGFVRDTRNDPLNSTHGLYNAIELGAASRYLGSQTSYLRLVGRNSSYHRAGRELVFARSVTFAWLHNTAGDPDDRPIPLPELFFSGGASSHRAFPDNQAGPRDLETGFVVGGRAILMHNLELRFPLLGDNLGGVLFHDAGNVYSDIGSLSLRFSQRDKQDFDYMVHSFGFGVRYRTPIGPVRVDLSVSPNSPRFFGFEGSREDLIGGGGRQVDQRINRFQFFFSIGQTF